MFWGCVAVMQMMDSPEEHVVAGFLDRRGDRPVLRVHMPPSAAPSPPPAASFSRRFSF